MGIIGIRLKIREFQSSGNDAAAEARRLISRHASSREKLMAATHSFRGASACVHRASMPQQRRSEYLLPCLATHHAARSTPYLQRSRDARERARGSAWAARAPQTYQRR